MTTSRIPGFYRLTLEERRKALRAAVSDLPDDVMEIWETGGLGAGQADQIVENALGVYSMPLGVALNALINDEDRFLPMVVEEPSVIAAASNACKMIRAGGGFHGSVPEAHMIAQIELRDVPDAENAFLVLAEEKSQLLSMAGDVLPGLVRRGGGARELEVRQIAPDHLVVHLHLDCRDAMGANLANTAAEHLGPRLAELTGAELGLCILSNLSDRRLVEIEARVPFATLASSDTPAGEAEAQGADVALAIERASVFAERDPYRAATHNKGIMNGVDSVVIATGNDYRAVEAGAHAFAGREGGYHPLATWRREGETLVGRLRMPLAVGTVGGTLRVHPGARVALRVAGEQGASDLALLCGCAGLASNLAALRALATDGIQKGHMALHARSVALAAGATGDEVTRVAAEISAAKTVTKEAALASLEALRSAALEDRRRS